MPGTCDEIRSEMFAQPTLSIIEVPVPFLSILTTG